MSTSDNLLAIWLTLKCRGKGLATNKNSSKKMKVNLYEPETIKKKVVRKG